ncbi:TKL protein kinase [Thecamonas trahens ATCC 50062]|uniref:TKL protein kinase n=1 Tax=Thecamonas trahens ATCC 50062 TaxID=461836 RepID=A0A0L0DEK3_THETB|nr:TKL protein kinase [Thecamonas trahens ATCC 50062]KNC50762.1 TKL protein kinase [Thecamonas trahens ATCC 50062]|eukprot:XP_013756724.1 TKL protein kinase [Thecamonas trahens ATCC 50062]
MHDFALTPQLLVWIWEGRITRWNDPRIVAANPGVTLPNATVAIVAHGDAGVDVVVARLQTRLGSSMDEPAVGEGMRIAVASMDEAMTRVMATVHTLTVVTSETAVRFTGSVTVARMLPMHGAAIAVSRHTVEVGANGMDISNLAALASGVTDGWPLVYAEWLMIPRDLSDVSHARCEAIKSTVAGAMHLVSSRFVQAHAWDHGHVPLPPSIVEYALASLESIKCGGTFAAPSVGSVRGSGKTVAAPLYLSTMALFNELKGRQLRYQSHGLGMADVVGGISVFGGVDVVTETDAQALDQVVVVPAAGISIALPYTLELGPGAPQVVPHLQLDGTLLANLFLGRVTRWDDAAISLLNPGLAGHLPNATICLAVLDTSSGTTYTLTSALSALSPEFGNRVGAVAYVAPGLWPAEDRGGCVVRYGSEADLASGIANSQNMIGASDYAHVRTHNLVTARMFNAAGRVVEPGVANVVSAMREADKQAAVSEPHSLVRRLVNMGGEQTWPICTYVYFTVQLASSGECSGVHVFAEFYSWLLTSEDAPLAMARAAVAPLPNTTVADALALLGTATCNGVPVFGGCFGKECRVAPSLSPTGLVVLYVVLGATGVICCVAAIGMVWHCRARDVVFKLDVAKEVAIELDELEVCSAVGAGSFGTVYLVKWRGAPMAVKHVHDLDKDATRLNAFVSEAKMLMQLRHPYIVLFMGIVVEPAGLVTEYMPNGSLYSALHNFEYALGRDLVLWWAHCIALGLDFLHSAGVVHRDMKSLNVLLDAGWVPKICDFGLSAVISPKSTMARNGDKKRGVDRARSTRRGLFESPSLAVSDKGDGLDKTLASSDPFEARIVTQVGSGGFNTQSIRKRFALRKRGAGANKNLGSLLWTAPEVLDDGVAAASSASDVYAFAVTLWELLSRCDPYSGRNPVSVALEVSVGLARPILSVIPGWAHEYVPLLTDGWHQDASERPTMAEIAQQLASKYSLSEVVTPSVAALPSGHVVLARASLVNGAALLFEAPKVAETILGQFHNAMRQAATMASAHMLETTLTDVLIAFKVASQVAVFAQYFLTESESELLEATRLVVAQGSIVSRVVRGQGVMDKQLVFSGSAVERLVHGLRSKAALRGEPGLYVTPSVVKELGG